MAVLFEEIRKNNPYHDTKTGKFTTASGAGFTPVDLGADYDESSSDSIGDYVSRISGDLVTVGGVDYRDLGGDGYDAYIKEHGFTRDHDLSERTEMASMAASAGYVGTGKSFDVNRYLRFDRDPDKLAQYLRENKGFFGEERSKKEAERIAEQSDRTIESMDRIIAADTIKSDMMLTRYVDFSMAKGISREVQDAVDRGAENSEIISLINKKAGQVVTEKGYISASMAAESNYFRERPVRLALLTPEGTPAFVTYNTTESEVVLGRNTNMRLVGAQEIEGDSDRQIQIIYQVIKNDVEKSAVRTPEMITVELADDKKKIIRQMMGIEEPEEEVKKYNHNHDANGRFCSAGAGVVVDPSGSKSSVRTVSKLTGQPVRDFSKEICADVIQDKEFKEARKRVSESFDAMQKASDEAHAALKARKPKPREEWDSDDELRDLIGIRPMTGEKEWREAYKKEDAAREQWDKDAKAMKKIMVDAQGGAKTNKDFSDPQPASKEHYPGFKDTTGVSWYDDAENLRYHGLQARVVEMSPAEYLERCAANFNSAKEDATDRTSTLAGQVLQMSTSNVEKLQKLMENGGKMDMPYLNVGSGGGEQEGRHRAMAAYNLGMEKIPVLYVDSRGIVKSAVYEDFLEYHFAKKNPYHGEDGRFTFAPNGAHKSDANVSRETHESATSSSAWSDHIKSERERLSGEKQSEKALYACDHHAASMDDCVAAMNEGKADELLDRYFKIIEQNGDYRPTKETSGQISIDKDGYSLGWTEARTKAIRETTGCDRPTAQEYQKSLETYFSGSSITAEDTGIIDDYVSKAPAFNDTMYRGIAWGSGDGRYDDFIKNVRPGSEIDMRGQVSSWSSSEEVARGFAHHGDDNADSVMLVCVGNRTATPVNHLSRMGESEVLAGSQAKWTVLHSESAEWSSGARKTWVYVIEKGEE